MSSAINSRKPLYSVIIVTYNSSGNIRVCLDSLRRCGHSADARAAGSHEIIVVDNNSRDGTQDYLRAQDDIRPILNTENNGFSKGCNQGAAIAKGEYLVFLNPDTLATEGWTDTMARYFKDPQVGAVGPVSNYVAGLQRLDMNLPPAWRDASTIPGNGAVEVSENVARILRESNTGKGVVTKLLIGFCLMMERSRFESLGGMDENLFLGNDDLDLSWRLRNLGLKLVVASDAFIFHEGQKSFKTEAKSHVDRLTQESTDEMYVKLVEHYGGRDKVPSAIELWGIGWFSPSPSLLQGPLPKKGEIMDSGRGLKIKQDKESFAKTEPREQNAWKAVTTVIYVGADADVAGGGSESSPGDALARLERTLATLPAKPGTEIIVLNCAGSSNIASAPEAPAGSNLRKLDFGPRFPVNQALDIALSLMPGSHVLFCMAGVELSAMFNHWLDKRDPAALGASLPLPLRIGDADKVAACPAFAFVGAKDWLKEALAAVSKSTATTDTAACLSALGDRIRDAAAQSSAGKPADPPWLMARASDLPELASWTGVKDVRTGVAAPEAVPAKPAYNLLKALTQMGRTEAQASLPPAVAAAAQAITATVPVAAASKPVGSAPAPAVDAKVSSGSAAEPAVSGPPLANSPLSLYPESLRAAMRGAMDIGFAGTAAEAPPIKGAFRVFDAQGELVPVQGQDLLILRVTPDLIDGLTERLINLRRVATGLKRLITVFDGAKAKGIAAVSPVAPVDLTKDGIRTALWGAGFAVTGERDYVGFPEGGSHSENENLRGWIQTEAIPRTTAHVTEKMVSIVILGFNQVEYTKKCIESIRKYTRQKYELILVDNGSKDGTEAYFRSIPGAKVIRNPENLGVSKGWNQGMRIADGEYILILNNDIIVGPDWLENMVRLAESDPSIGLVGPRSNYIAGPQVVADVPYKAEGDIQPFIRKWQEEHSLAAAEFGFIKGFCHLIPRRVFAKVGFYDERFGKGNFEDDDYCLRVRYHGFRALFAHDVFIHHYGSVSFNQESVDWRALMIENQKKYEQKWAKGAAAVNDTVVDEVSAPRRQASPKLAEGLAAFEKGDTQRARALFLEAQASDPADAEAYCCLGVLMFTEGSVQDAVSFFMRCLNLDPNHEDAARNVMDAISFRNGGFSDEEAAALAARYPSNKVLAAAKSGPAAMEPPEAPSRGAAQRPPAASLPPVAPAVERPTWTPAPARPALPAWREEVESLIEKAKYAEAMDRLESRVRRNEDPGACYNYLGIIAHACGDAEMALKHFSTALAHSPADVDIIFNKADTLLAIGRPGEAARLLEDHAPKTGVESDPTIVDLAATAEQIRYAMSRGNLDSDNLLASRDANQQAESLLRAGAIAEAKAYLDVALESDPEDFRALNNMGLLAWYQDDGESAWNSFNRCLAVRPTWMDALINAFDTALALHDIDSILPCADKALAASPNHASALAIRRHILAQGPAIYQFKSFEQLEANAALLAKAELALEQARQGDAIAAFLEAIKLQPQNPQAYNGLGIIAFGEKRHADAFGLFEAASGLHPVDQDILMNFWHCAKELRREGEVMPKLRSSLSRNPALEDVKAIVREFA
ncbi:MAG: hypothetical protein JWP91_4081 [Fibrobacteres bacterium]|nr:hypothetical protein [Fibrobacterota bacterium]